MSQHLVNLILDGKRIQLTVSEVSMSSPKDVGYSPTVVASDELTFEECTQLMALHHEEVDRQVATAIKSLNRPQDMV